MTSVHALENIHSLSDGFTTWYADDERAYPETILAHQSLAYVYPDGEVQVEFVEQANAYWLVAKLPGLQQDDMTIRVDDNQLSIFGEWPDITDVSDSPRLVRPHRTFARQFQLDEPVDADAISTTYQDEVLSVYVPKLAVSQAESWSHVMVESLR